VFLYKKLPAFKWIPAIVAFWFIAISMYHALGYYYHSFAVFAIFPILMYLTFFNRFITRKKFYLALFASVIIIIVFAGNLVFLRPNFFLNKTEERSDFYYVNYILSQVHNPKIMFSFYDMGYGTPAHALPGCKYWTGYLGATDKMVSEREFAIKQNLSDFVFVMNAFDNNFTYLLQQSGYIKYYTWTIQEATQRYETHLYGKPDLFLPPNHFHISLMDVLLKRRILPRKPEN